MRVISGIFGGRKIRTANDKGLRPAMGRTREALFSMLESGGMSWQGATVLDLFAGSGSLALECLSRGAKYAVLVDSSSVAAECIAYNISSFGLENRAEIARMDVLRFLRSGASMPADLVFLDPPYRLNLANAVFDALCSGNWLHPGSFVVSEVEKEARLNPPENFLPLAERLYGQTCLRIWEVL